jgi:hypothetical protein
MERGCVAECEANKIVIFFELISVDERKNDCRREERESK